MEQKKIGLWTTVGTVLLCVIVLAGCTGVPETITPTITPTAQDTVTHPTTTTAASVSGSVKDVAEANNRFTFDLYSYFTKDPDYAENNLFFSPFSISSALAITYEGARGMTADEIRSVFYFPDDTATMRQGFAETNAGINKGSAGYILHTANALWAEKTYAFLPGYTSIASQYYGANVTNLDFINQPEESRTIINHWVEQKTENKIKDLIPAGVIDPVTRLVITNAVYFKGTWVRQFDKNDTQEADFRVSPEKTVKVSMMQRDDENAVYRYTETDDIQVLTMPYAHSNGKELSMLVILPKGDNLTAAEHILDPATLSGIQNSSIQQRVKVFLPKFRLETEYRLSEALAAMGMPAAFSGAADFSGMDGTKNLFIGDVIHKAFVDVNEEGTEAAAATAVVMKLSAVPEEHPIPVFKADHPFIFIIQDDETGTILFMGRVMNPVG
jgi:serpin B